MKTETKKIGGIAAATLLVGLLLGWFLFGGSEDRPTEAHQHTTEVAGETLWTCSMHPQIRQNEPGNCPICGMELIPLESDSNADLDPMAISMSPTALQIAQVVTEQVGKANPVKNVRLNGKVTSDERAVYSQSSHIPGRIESLRVNFTGEYVSKGQVIATVYSPDLVNAQEELFEARKIADTQPDLYEAAKEKLKNWKLTDAQISQILTTGKVREEFPIQADISGFVTEKMVNLGDYIQRGMPIYQIANLSQVWVLFDVYEADLAWVKKGDKVAFTIPSLPGKSFEGKITYLDPVINPATRVAKARVELNNKDQELKPEMFVSGIVMAQLPIKSDAIVIPKSAVMWTGKRSVVYLKKTTASGVQFTMREVDLGPGLGDSFVVNQGLVPGEEIATNGTFSIDAAAQLAGKPSMMNPQGGPAMTGHNHGGNPSGAPANSGPGATSQPQAADHTAMDQRLQVDGKFSAQLQRVFDAYTQMKDALVNDNASSAQKSAAPLLKALAGVDMKLLSNAEAHNHWMSLAGELESGAKAIGGTGAIERQRGHFKHLSAHMAKAVRLFGINQEVYEQFCPMADNNQGAYWLSLEENIRNPYMGSKMLTCGTTEATISKK